LVSNYFWRERIEDLVLDWNGGTRIINTLREVLGE
jgi:hypothetical protein